MSRTTCWTDYTIAENGITSEKLRTALRKRCNSSMTGIAYNAIELMDDKTWNYYISWLNNCSLTLCSFTPKTAIGKHIKEWSLSWRPGGLYNYPANILRLAFESFSEEDWDGYSTYVKLKIVKGQKTRIRRIPDKIGYQVWRSGKDRWMLDIYNLSEMKSISRWNPYTEDSFLKFVRRNPKIKLEFHVGQFPKQKWVRIRGKVSDRIKMVKSIFKKERL